MIQALLKGRGGVIESNFLESRPSSCTVSLYTGDASVKVDAQSATVDTVNTTLAGASAAGVASLSLASAAGVVVGRRYLIGAAASTQSREVVTVKEVAGITATLWAPLGYNHAAGSAFGGTRVSYAVGSSQADVLWWDGYADFTPDTGDVQSEVVDCVLRKIPENLIDETDLRKVFAQFPKMNSAELDMKAALREARDEFLRAFGGKNRAYCAIGADHFRRPCALTFFMMRRHEYGDEWAEAMDRVEHERDVLIAKLQSEIPFDNDQDGKTTGRSDGAFTVISLSRA